VQALMQLACGTSAQAWMQMFRLGGVLAGVVKAAAVQLFRQLACWATRVKPIAEDPTLRLHTGSLLAGQKGRSVWGLIPAWKSTSSEAKLQRLAQAAVQEPMSAAVAADNLLAQATRQDSPGKLVQACWQATMFAADVEKEVAQLP